MNTPSTSSHNAGNSTSGPALRIPSQPWHSDSITTESNEASEIPLLHGSSPSPTSRPLRYGLPSQSNSARQAFVDEAGTSPSFTPESPPMDFARYTLPPSMPSSFVPVDSDVDATQNAFADSLDRDALLSYAYHLYDSREGAPQGLTAQPLFEPLPRSTQNPTELYKARLLPLLLTLKSLHPTYIPVLLLLACTYHVLGDFEASLQVDYEILRLDPHYAEAMCNIGTTMHALGRNEEAFEWWWKAIRSRPTYWDAIDNLIGLLFSSTHTVPPGLQRDSIYTHALEVCAFVEERTIDDMGRLKVSLQPADLHRLQRVFFTKASLIMLSSNDLPRAAKDYFRAIELVIRPPPPIIDDELYTVRELILASYIIALSMSSASDGALPREIWDTLHLDADTPFATRLNDPNFNIYHVVRAAGSPLVDALLHYGSGALPFVLLLPEQVAQLPTLLFRSSRSNLPGICIRNAENGTLQVSSEDVLQKTNLMTSTVLLTVGKRYQDLTTSNVVVPGFAGPLNVNHSLCILLYYLSIALVPSPSTYNNAGIILASVSAVRTYVDNLGHKQTLNGPTLAKVYYETGLHLAPSHPHLLTNLGSLYKDQGHTDKAMQLYLKAVQAKPDFDVALANLGNLVKDTGRSWEAIDYYRRALSVNPDLPEAVCGLISSLTSVCDWRGRGGLSTEVSVDDKGDLIPPGSPNDPPRPGYFTRMVEITEKQINQGYLQNRRILSAAASVEEWLDTVARAYGRNLHQFERDQWGAMFSQFSEMHAAGSRESINEGGFVIRFLHWLQPRLQRRWYISVYGKLYTSNRPVGRVPSGTNHLYTIPEIPKVMTPPSIPSVLPFNTFTYPLSPRLIRLIAHRHSLRISHTALTQPWLPRPVYPPPKPPLNGKLRIAYLSNDVNNHPLSHLMSSVFGMHDRSHFTVFLYTTSEWDGTEYRPKMAREVEHFVDASTWTTEQIVSDIVKRQVHVLINLGGYTKGARNDVFAARPCPVQMQLMGYPGTLGAGWCDYLVCDPTACPPELSAPERWLRIQRNSPQSTSGPLHIAPTVNSPLDMGADLDPETKSEDWVYTEKFLYMPHTFMVTDHKQSFRIDEPYSAEERLRVPVAKLWADEEARRYNLKKSTFPDIPQDCFIFANFNQLYKIDPEIFAVWLRILTRVPRSILWLLRFPEAGEEHLIRTARQWAGDEVASRVRFGEVATKKEHIMRARVADLFLDTTECNAHTVTADVLWSGTPILTWPRHVHKMSSRVAASMANATGFGDQMVVNSLEDYEERAVAFALNVRYTPTQTPSGHSILKPEGTIINLRRNVFLNRDRMPLFDTQRWVRNIEKGYVEAWRRWVDGTQYELSDEWNQCEGPEKQSACIWVEDHDEVSVVRYD